MHQNHDAWPWCFLLRFDMHNPLGNFTEGGDDMVLFTTAVCLQQAEKYYKLLQWYFRWVYR